ncbi:MAG: hypothetical protein JWO53_752 [Chlamydiia bacterium]|nr:hypothetical protein [Chlamydiia bacterium]
MHAKIRKIEIEAKQRVLDLFSGMYRSRFKGNGVEVEDLREYQPGDEMRSISWTRSAQMGRPFVKTFREERDLNVILLVDVSASELFGSHFELKRERIAELGALLAFSAIYNHDQVGLILFSSQIEKYIPPKRGSRHGVRLIHELLTFEPKERGTNIAQPLRLLNTVLQKRCIAFFISDFLATGYDKEFLLAARKNDLIALRIFDPAEEKLPFRGLLKLRDLETGECCLVDSTEDTDKAFSERQHAFVAQFKKLVGTSGGELIELSTKGAYLPILRAFFKARKRRG